MNNKENFHIASIMAILYSMTTTNVSFTSAQIMLFVVFLGLCLYDYITDKLKK
jgi:hypothetical protein